MGTKGQSMFSSAAYILGDMLNDTKNVKIEHDEDWKLFPEVGETFKEASGEEYSFAVATCSKTGKWGVGASSGWKGRGISAKLALCVALAADVDKPIAKKLARN